ncbi:MAG: hypothetical protein QGH46_01430 [Gammaproteobacteria bacterium]|jgi:hypothetical protein|nr:hypothetical protein [Gammaproteobacteria bacterium]MDP7093882.1 hypothetical protein [Gammaproteobacteria bacterium]MDP7270582.1 hypothetical protein [Gammaproteobacteria bacterium]HJP04315.1 hypothetical protein [Gammaproteobacteria bacterium]
MNRIFCRDGLPTAVPVVWLALFILLLLVPFTIARAADEVSWSLNTPEGNTISFPL